MQVGGLESIANRGALYVRVLTYERTSFASGLSRESLCEIPGQLRTSSTSQRGPSPQAVFPLNPGASKSKPLKPNALHHQVRFRVWGFRVLGLYDSYMVYLEGAEYLKQKRRSQKV